MPQQQLERFFARILFKYQGQGEREGRTIMFSYNRETLDKLNIVRDKYDKAQFIEIGNTLMLEGRKCKVVEINFKLEDHLNDMTGGYGINIYSPTDPTDFNCTIGVFVEPLD